MPIAFVDREGQISDHTRIRKLHYVSDTTASSSTGSLLELDTTVTVNPLAPMDTRRHPIS
jgi:hypothetical protein